MTPPNPGSEEAGKMGCICPVIDNSYGKGYYGSGDFVITVGCELHSPVAPLSEK